MSRAIKIGLIASFLLLLTVNLVMLDLMVFFGRGTRPSEVASSAVRVSETTTTTQTCSALCETKIDELAQKVASLTLESPSLGSSSKEYYIPLGSGVIKSNSWQDLAGVEAVVDTTKYAPIQSVTFEVYLKIPTANGKVHAKLYNVTDKHDVWFSEVSSEGPTLTKKEATITLEKGEKTYRVMGLSTLKYDANIENARLRIITY